MSNFIADQRNGAVNPYNFVSLGNGVERKAHNNNDNDNCNGNISGVIHCSLTNATPIALPDMPLCKTETVFNNGKRKSTKKHRSLRQTVSLSLREARYVALYVPHMKPSATAAFP